MNPAIYFAPGSLFGPGGCIEAATPKTGGATLVYDQDDELFGWSAEPEHWDFSDPYDALNACAMACIEWLSTYGEMRISYSGSDFSIWLKGSTGGDYVGSGEGKTLHEALIAAVRAVAGEGER